MRDAGTRRMHGGSPRCTRMHPKNNTAHTDAPEEKIAMLEKEVIKLKMSEILLRQEFERKYEAQRCLLTNEAPINYDDFSDLPTLPDPEVLFKSKSMYLDYVELRQNMALALGEHMKTQLSRFQALRNTSVCARLREWYLWKIIRRLIKNVRIDDLTELVSTITRCDWNDLEFFDKLEERTDKVNDKDNLAEKQDPSEEAAKIRMLLDEKINLLSLGIPEGDAFELEPLTRPSGGNADEYSLELFARSVKKCARALVMHGPDRKRLSPHGAPKTFAQDPLDKLKDVKHRIGTVDAVVQENVPSLKSSSDVKSVDLGNPRIAQTIYGSVEVRDCGTQFTGRRKSDISDEHRNTRRCIKHVQQQSSFIQHDSNTEDKVWSSEDDQDDEKKMSLPSDEKNKKNANNAMPSIPSVPLEHHHHHHQQHQLPFLTENIGDFCGVFFSPKTEFPAHVHSTSGPSLSADESCFDTSPISFLPGQFKPTIGPKKLNKMCSPRILVKDNSENHGPKVSGEKDPTCASPRTITMGNESENKAPWELGKMEGRKFHHALHHITKKRDKQQPSPQGGFLSARTVDAMFNTSRENSHGNRHDRSPPRTHGNHPTSIVNVQSMRIPKIMCSSGAMKFYEQEVDPMMQTCPPLLLPLDMSRRNSARSCRLSMGSPDEMATTMFIRPDNQ